MKEVSITSSQHTFSDSMCFAWIMTIMPRSFPSFAATGTTILLWISFTLPRTPSIRGAFATIKTAKVFIFDIQRYKINYKGCKSFINVKYSLNICISLNRMCFPNIYRTFAKMTAFPAMVTSSNTSFVASARFGFY